ncbi:MAG: glutamine amidotransferase [Micrococcales bacterium]|nr:glutamine amidotransferase [Micrococcales bacterium]
MTKYKPFLLLSSRAHDPAAAGEYNQVLRVGALEPNQLDWRRLESEPLADVDLVQYSGVLLGGSDFCASDRIKTELQQRVEADLGRVLDQVIDQDFPLLGMCYGIGMLASHLGGQVDREHGEPVGAALVSLTDAGVAEPLLAGSPRQFWAFVGHKEAANGPPPGATVLATGQYCPIQLFRVGRNVYASQYHPEINAFDLAERIHIYQHSGYFRPDEVEPLIAAAHESAVDGTQHLLLANFVKAHLTER